MVGQGEVLQEASPAALASRGEGQVARHQGPVEEANRARGVQQVPRLQRPCVDDDPW